MPPGLKLQDHATDQSMEATIGDSRLALLVDRVLLTGLIVREVDLGVVTQFLQIGSKQTRTVMPRHRAEGFVLVGECDLNDQHVESIVRVERLPKGIVVSSEA